MKKPYLMRRGAAPVLALFLALALLAGCGGAGAPAEADVPEPAEPVPAEAAETPAAAGPEELTAPGVVDDGRARPSFCGHLQVKDGKLCSESGEPVMLRGVSTNSLITAESFLNDKLFRELSEDDGVNLFRLAMYTYGVGIVGYCTGGDKERHIQDICDGVELAKAHDMYVIVDWHILSDGDPNRYADDAEAFFADVAERFSSYDNVLYEICNEPNNVDWAAVKQYAERIIPVIREKDPDSVIIVGNPDWSKDLRSVAADPLGFDNILYTLHFYSATHGQEFRDMTEELSRNGLPIFVTEFGVTASSGGFPRDLESADSWIDLLERENISWCMWSFSKAPEPCSAVRSSVIGYSGFKPEDYTDTGTWLLETLSGHTGR